MPYWRTETPSEIGALTSPQEFDPGAGETMWWGIKEGFRQSLIPALRDFARKGGEEEALALGARQPLSEEEWRSGPYFREGLEYPKEGISEEYAQILAEHTDEASERALVARRGPTAAFVAGTFIGGVPDPLNFLPFFGPAARTAAVARAGRTAGRALLSSAEATAGALALEPWLFFQAAAFQEDRDLSDSFWNVGFAAAVGAGFGTVASKINLRGVREHIQAKSQAVRQLIGRRSIDVEAELPQQRRPVNAAEVAQYEQALRTPARSRTPDQDALLRDIDVTDGEPLDMRAPPEDIPDRAADVAEPTTARNEGAHYKPVGEGEGILGAFYERSPGGRDVPVQALPETGAEGGPGGAPRAAPGPAPVRKVTFADQVPDSAEQSLPVLVDDEPSGITLHKGERDRSWQVRREGPQGRRIEGSGLTLRQAKATAKGLLKEAEAAAEAPGVRRAEEVFQAQAKPGGDQTPVVRNPSPKTTSEIFLRAQDTDSLVRYTFQDGELFVWTGSASHVTVANSIPGLSIFKKNPPHGVITGAPRNAEVTLQSFDQPALIAAGGELETELITALKNAGIDPVAIGRPGDLRPVRAATEIEAAMAQKKDPEISALEDSLGRELDPDEIADIRGAEEESATLSRKARAYESAAACLFGGG